MQDVRCRLVFVHLVCTYVCRTSFYFNAGCILFLLDTELAKKEMQYTLGLVYIFTRELFKVPPFFFQHSSYVYFFFKVQNILGW